jgi:hypothetical protein
MGEIQAREAQEKQGEADLKARRRRMERPPPQKDAELGDEP